MTQNRQNKRFEEIKNDISIYKEYAISELLYFVNSAELLANAMMELIEDENLRVSMGKNAEGAVQRFAKDKIAQKLLDFMKV